MVSYLYLTYWKKNWRKLILWWYYCNAICEIYRIVIPNNYTLISSNKHGMLYKELKMDCQLVKIIKRIKSHPFFFVYGKHVNTLIFFPKKRIEYASL